MVRIERKNTQIVASLDRSSLLPRSVIASRDGLRVAYVDRYGPIFRRSFCVSVNSTSGPKHKKVLFDSLRFSPNSKRLAYVTKTRAGFSVVVDGQEGRPYDRVFPGALRFSPEGGRLAYLAKDPRGFFWVVDEKEGMPHQATLDQLVFSPDGSETAYVAERGGKSVMVRNGTPTREHDKARQPVFSPDGNRFAYCAQEGKEKLIVLDGERQKRYDDLGEDSFSFSPDSQRFAYSAALAGKNLIVIDGTEIGPFESVTPGPACPAFSPDSRRLAYGTRQDGRLRVWVDGESFGELDELIVFYNMARGKDSAKVFCFSSDSSQILYHGKLGEHFVVVSNGEKLDCKLSSFTHPLVVAPNGQRWACAGVAGNRTRVIVDGIGYQPDHQILGSAMLFSPDSAHLTYMAARGPEQFVVVDDREGEAFGPLRFDEGDIVFDSPSQFHYLIMRDWDVCLIHDEILS